MPTSVFCVLWLRQHADVLQLSEKTAERMLLRGLLRRQYQLPSLWLTLFYLYASLTSARGIGIAIIEYNSLIDMRIRW